MTAVLHLRIHLKVVISLTLLEIELSLLALFFIINLL